MISFRALSLASSVIAAALALSLLGYPSLYFAVLGVEGTEQAFIIGRRTAVLFLGFSVMAFMARDAECSKSRQAICFSLSFAMFAMALLGLIELSRDKASATILIFVAAELLISLFYLLLWRDGRKQLEGN